MALRAAERAALVESRAKEPEPEPEAPGGRSIRMSMSRRRDSTVPCCSLYTYERTSLFLFFLYMNELFLKEQKKASYLLNLTRFR